jgi:hypothetical protein
MNCAEFQRSLPYIIDGGGSAEEDQHLRSCTVCADLVQDLRYIAEQAKLLVPMEDPSPRVWDGITKSLEREGLVKPAPARRGLLGPQRQSWGWMLPVAALLALAVGLFLYRNANNVVQAPTDQAAQVPDGAAVNDEDGAQDQQVLEVVAQNQPSQRDHYAQNLKSVNAYIRDAKATLQQNPDDNEAKEYLMQAYGQKAMLYQMAARTGE